MKAREKVQKNKKIWGIRLSQTHAIEHSKRFLKYVKNSSCLQNVGKHMGK